MALSKKDKLRLLTILLESRHGDLREQSLNRQGKGHFHVAGMGHEALAAISLATEPGDYICGYYRDRALVLGRGVSSAELALDYFAKRKGQSHGRQMPSHYSYAAKNIWSVPTPTGVATASRLRHRLGHQARRETEPRHRDDRRRRHPPGRFLRGGLFCKREAAPGALPRRGQRLRDQQPDAKDQPARDRRPSA